LIPDAKLQNKNMDHAVIKSPSLAVGRVSSL
jgi:hypothetical protein